MIEKPVNRRTFIRIAGFSVAAGGLLAACSGSASPSLSPARSAASVAATSSARASTSAGASASAAASQQAKVTVGFSQLTGSETVLYLASDRKLFQKYGVDATVTRVEGTTMPPAMKSGDLQFGTIGGSELVSVNAGGLPMVMLAATENVPVFSLYGAKGVTDVQQLAGKTIAVTSIGSSTDAAAHLFMQHFGLDAQVKHQAAGTAQGILATLERGDAAAGIMSVPDTLKAAQDGLKELVNGPKLGLPFVQSGLSVTRAYLQSDAHTVMALLRGYYDAWKFTTDKANEPAVVQTIMKWTSTNQQLAKATYDYDVVAWSAKGMPAVNLAGIQTIINLSQNPKAKSLRPDDLVDNSVLSAIMKQKA